MANIRFAIWRLRPVGKRHDGGFYAMTTLKVGIADTGEMKARTLRIARGEEKPSPDDPKIWFISTESFSKVLSAPNREMLRLIAEEEPESLDALAELTGRAKGLFEDGLLVRPVALSKGHEVARAALAVGGELSSDGRLMLQPQTPVTVGFQLTNDEVTALEIQIVDAATDAVLYASDGSIPVKLGF